MCEEYANVQDSAMQEEIVDETDEYIDVANRQVSLPGLGHDAHQF